MKIVYAARALRDIDEILAYIQQRSPRGAHSASLAIEYTIRTCALNPRAVGKTSPTFTAVRSASIGTRCSIESCRTMKALRWPVL